MTGTQGDKRQDFLWVVQMFMLRDTDVIGWRGFAGDAVAASYRIPNDMTARDAAREFWSVCSPEFSGDEDYPVPAWLFGLSEPNYI